MPISKTPNLNLTTGYESTDKIKDWRTGVDSNFAQIDTQYGRIKQDLTTATTEASTWEAKVEEVTAENSQIYLELAKKVTAESGKSMVATDLIEKLENDYTKDEIDDTFVTKTVLENTIITAEDINLDNYYTRSEVNGLIIGGSADALKDYYTKQEVDDKLIGDNDIDAIIDFIDALNGYELSMQEFDELNGNGSE